MTRNKVRWRPTRLQALWMIGLGASSYGLISPVLKSAFAYGYSMEGVTAAQYIVALLFWATAAITARSGVRPDSRDRWRLLALGLFGSGGTTVLYYRSLVYLPASLAIVLLFQFTWIAILMETFLEKKRLTARRLQALVMILLGTGLAVGLLQDQWQGGISLGGVALALGAAVTYSVLLYGTGKIAVNTSPIHRSLFISLGAGLPILLSTPPAAYVGAPSIAGLYGWGALVALLAQVVPPLLFAVAIPAVGGGAAAVLGSMELPVAVVAAALILKEPVGWDRWLGVALILLGVVWSERMSGKRRESSGA
ncbi:MAG: DMT family transporter [Kyrpidia sp.]|nr:DMT family transporter [Kyrpidia sp.]